MSSAHLAAATPRRIAQPPDGGSGMSGTITLQVLISPINVESVRTAQSALGITAQAQIHVREYAVTHSSRKSCEGSTKNTRT
jgi:hypothetical protein